VKEDLLVGPESLRDSTTELFPPGCLKSVSINQTGASVKEDLLVGPEILRDSTTELFPPGCLKSVSVNH